MLLLRSIFAGKNIDLKIASVAQAIIQASKSRVIMAPLQLGLAVQMHHYFSSLSVVTSGVHTGSFIQSAADNVGHNSRTLDCTGLFNGMGMIGYDGY